MSREDYIKDIINETLGEVFQQGWDLLDEYEANRDEGVERVYNAIKDRIL